MPPSSQVMPTRSVVSPASPPPGNAKRPESEVWEIARCLYDSEGQTASAADAKTAAMTELVSRAGSCDLDAIELLLNLAAGSNDIAKLAQEALLTLYGNPQTSEALRAELRTASYNLCELVLKANEHVDQQQSTAPVTSAPAVAPHSVSLPLAYLGGQYAHECNYPAREAEIEAHIAEKLPALLGGKLLASNREVTDDELAGVEQRLNNLKIHNAVLDTSNAATFEQVVNDIAIQTRFQALQNKPPIMAAWLHAEGHWLPAVFEWKEDSLHCTVLDSYADRASAAACNQKLWELSQQHQITPHMISANMQENAPNACGVLGTRLFMQIDQNLAAGSKQPIAEQIQSYIQAWNGLDKDQQSAVILAERAALLTGLAEVNQSIAQQ